MPQWCAAVVQSGIAIDGRNRCKGLMLGGRQAKVAMSDTPLGR